MTGLKLLLIQIHATVCTVQQLGKESIMPELKRVGMTLTQRDCNNVEKLQERAGLRTKAQAVSLALSVAEFMVSEWQKGSTFILRNKTTGELQKIIRPI